MAEMKIERLHFTKVSMKSFSLEVTAVIDPEVDIGWISDMTISLVYGRRLIGEKVLRDTHIIPDETNKVELMLEGFEIRNMIRFKTFIENAMPETKVTTQKNRRSSIMATLETDDNGHELSIIMDMASMSKTTILHPKIHIVDGKVRISFTTSSSNPVDLPFGWCQFLLKKDKKILAFLDGHFDIQPDKCEILMEGDAMVPNADFSGTGILKGFKTYDNSTSWLAHAIRSFEIEVNLDKTVSSSNAGNAGGEGGEGGEEDEDESYEDDGDESESESEIE
ncbi:hypothetical protein V8C42DRAFT_358536 [Trichoderma barbatum]